MVDNGQTHSVKKELTGFAAALPKKIRETYAEISKHVKLVKSAETAEWLSTKQTGEVVYWDRKLKAWFDKPFDKNNAQQVRVKLFEVKLPYTVPSGINTATSKGENQTNQDTNNKATLVKNGDQYGISFRLSLFGGASNGSKDQYFDELINTPTEQFQFITKAQVDAQVDKAALDYPDKSNVFDREARQDSLTKTGVDEGYTLVVKEFAPMEGQDSVSVKITVTATYDGITVESKERTVQINGFKRNEFGSQFTNINLKYENKETVSPSQVNVETFKLTNGSETEYQLPDGVTKQITITQDSQNDYKGTLSVTLVLTKGTETWTKSFDLTGFKVTQFVLQTYADALAQPTIAESVNKSETFAADVAKSSITLPTVDAKAASAEITSLAPKSGDNTTLVVTVTYTDLVNEGSATYVKHYEYTGFKSVAKEYKSPELAAQVGAKDLFIFQDTPENRKKLIKHAQAKTPQFIAVNGGKVTDKNSKGKPIGITLKESVKNLIATHKGNATVAAAVASGNQKGVNIVYENNSIILRFVLILKDGTRDDVVYEQILFTENTSQ
ncbi:lipoprotein 17-related variable surface protein [Mycoplasma simbae]|uniref:lipoprotein 17-related variable surface protein n=1 Tax=Mycoplasma simbae TaxID=36744 RepID=UPI00049831C5|nr:lipoprotein 17-related variable surface protein [Mycoplasma simbae]